LLLCLLTENMPAPSTRTSLLEIQAWRTRQSLVAGSSECQFRVSLASDVVFLLCSVSPCTVVCCVAQRCVLTTSYLVYCEACRSRIRVRHDSGVTLRKGVLSQVTGLQHQTDCWILQKAPQKTSEEGKMPTSQEAGKVKMIRMYGG